MRFRLLAFLTFVLAACAPLLGNTAGPDTPVTSSPEERVSTNEPFVNPFSPKPGDEKLTHGNVFINSTSLVIRESYPPQISLSISGDLPTPCHELRAEIASPDPENQIMVDVYSVSDPNVACVAVIKSFQESINLGTFPGGHYSVWVNGELAGEFDA